MVFSNLKMSHKNDTLDSDDDAPESLSLSQSKASAKKYDDIRLATEANTKRKLKEKNRRMDEILKERSTNNRSKPGRRNGDSTSKIKDGSTISERSLSNEKGPSVEREGESNEDGPLADEQSEEVASNSDDEFAGFRAGQSSAASEDDDLAMESDESEDLTKDENMSEMSGTESESDTLSISEKTGRKQSQREQLDNLPDHFFSSALSTITPPKSPDKKKKVNFKTESNKLHQSRLRKHKSHKAKDIVVGSKTVRTVDAKKLQTSIAASRTVPPTKVKRFFETSLGLGSYKKGFRTIWERKPTNIVVNRSHLLPARSFVRNG